MSFPPAAIPGFVATENVIIYHMVASSSFLFWDYCITFADEVRLIWRRKINYVSALFLSIRYLSISVKIIQLFFYTDVMGTLHPSVKGCVAWSWFEAISGHLQYTLVEILLIMRIFAFYERNKALLVVLVILLVAEHAPSFVFLGLTLPKFKFLPNPFPPNIHASACLTVFVPPLFADYWAPGFAFQAILFLLLIYKFIHTKLKTTMSAPRLLNVFVRDGAWAFVIIFAMLLWNQLAFVISPQNGEIALAWLYSAFGFCGSRLVLNLRVAARKVQLASQAGDSLPMSPITPMSPRFSLGMPQPFNFLQSEDEDVKDGSPVSERSYGMNVHVTTYTEARAI